MTQKQPCYRSCARKVADVHRLHTAVSWSLVAGVSLAPGLLWAQSGSFVLVFVLGLALGRVWSQLLAWLSLGLLIGWSADSGDEPSLRQLQGPVETVVWAGSWHSGSFGSWWCDVDVERLIARGRIVSVPKTLRVVLTAADAPTPGSLLRLRGQLKLSEGFHNAVGEGPERWLLRVKSDRLVERETTQPGLLGITAGVHRMREELRARALSPPTRSPLGRALVAALVWGDRSGLPEALMIDLRRLGVVHILAVSGLHVTLVVGLSLGLSRPLGFGMPWCRRTLRSALVLTALGVYWLLAGSHPSLLRAGGMTLLLLLTLTLRRRPVGGTVLALCVGSLTVIDPTIVDLLAFRLSVLATAGIYYLSPLIEAKLGFLPAPLRASVAVSMAAQLATLPITVTHFGFVSPLAFVLNLIVVPWLSVALVASLVGTLAVLATGHGQGALDAVVELLAQPLALLGHLPASHWLTFPLHLGPLELCCLVLVLGLLRTRPSRLVAGLLVLLTPAAGTVQAQPRLVMLDVGQGDSILLQDGVHRVLVDGGGWPHGDFGGRVLLPALAQLRVGSLDAIVLSHADRDHCGGLVDLSHYLPIGEVWMTAGASERPCGGELARLFGKRTRTLGDHRQARVGRWQLEVLHPEADGATDNDGSLVILASVLERQVLLTGDISAEVEAQLARRYQPLELDVLKVAHHGSRSSTSRRFLEAFTPRRALISAGRGNAHGHPHAEVLERLKGAGAEIYRTDQSGRLILRFGREVSVETALGQ